MPDWREGIGQTAVIEDINKNSWKQEFFDWQAGPFIYSGKGIDFRTDSRFGQGIRMGLIRDIRLCHRISVGFPMGFQDIHSFAVFAFYGLNTAA